MRFVSTVKDLGVYLDEQLSFDGHISIIKRDGYRMLRNIRKRRFLFDENQIKLLVNSLTICRVDYCNSLFYGISEKCLRELQLLQNAAAKTVFGLYKHDHMGVILSTLHWLPLKFRIHYKLVLLVYKCLNGMGPVYLSELLSYSSCSHTLVLNEPLVKSLFGRRAFCKAGPYLWNALPSTIRECSSLDTFKIKLKTHLFELAFSE